MDDSPAITDATLAKWKGGDRDAFLAAVSPWHDRIYRIAYRIVGASHDAEEVWQTLMLRLLQCGVALPAACDFPAWLRRCAVNESISLLRRQGGRINQSRHNADAGEIPSVGPDPIDAIADAELRERLADEMSRQSPEQRAMLSLRYDECLTVRQIAAVLERPRSTIHSQLGQAIECLKQRFAFTEDGRIRDG